MVLRAERAYMRAIEPDAERQWTEALDRNRALWVDALPGTTMLDVDGHPAGYVMWARLDGVPTVVTIQVLPEYRRRGLGRALLDLAVGQVREQGERRLVLGVHRDNPGAAALYEGAGFARSGTDGDYLLYERHLDVSAARRQRAE
jgi:ribosomal protein S18 acetylase RimI-like enzyme